MLLFKKIKFNIQGGTKRWRKNPAAIGATVNFSNVQGPAGRVVKLSVPACNLHSASWLYALYVLVRRKPFFPSKPLQRPGAEDGPPKKDSSLRAHA